MTGNAALSIVRRTLSCGPCAGGVFGRAASQWRAYEARTRRAGRVASRAVAHSVLSACLRGVCGETDTVKASRGGPSRGPGARGRRVARHEGAVCCGSAFDPTAEDMSHLRH